MTCPTCGETMVGDGYRTVLHCPEAPEDAYRYAEPDANPIYCTPGAEDPPAPWEAPEVRE